MSSAGLKKISKSPEETISIGREIGKSLPNSAVVCFAGDLGAGKTTLIKGIASELTEISLHEIHSPTFTYLNIYEGKTAVYHIDCYRLEGEQHFIEKGLEEYLEGLCLIEWPERIPSLLSNKHGIVTIQYSGENERVITYEKSLI